MMDLRPKDTAAIDQYHAAVRKWLNDEVARFSRDFLVNDHGDDDAMLAHCMTVRLMEAEWTKDRNATIHAFAATLIALTRASGGRS